MFIMQQIWSYFTTFPSNLHRFLRIFWLLVDNNRNTQRQKTHRLNMGYFGGKETTFHEHQNIGRIMTAYVVSLMRREKCPEPLKSTTIHALNISKRLTGWVKIQRKYIDRSELNQAIRKRNASKKDSFFSKKAQNRVRDGDRKFVWPKHIPQLNMSAQNACIAIPS